MGREKKVSKGKPGRPGYKYDDYITEEVKENIPKWKKSGMNETQIAKKIGISQKKLIEWKKKYLELEQLLKQGKEELCVELENTLYKRALGYFVTDTTTEVEKSEKNGKTTKVKKIKKYIWSDKCLELAVKSLIPHKFNEKFNDVDISDPEYLAKALKRLPKEKLEKIMELMEKSED